MCVIFLTLKLMFSDFLSLTLTFPVILHSFSDQVPQQRNDYDCGLFVLFFMERFIDEAPQRLKKKDLAMVSIFSSKFYGKFIIVSALFLHISIFLTCYIIILSLVTSGSDPKRPLIWDWKSGNYFWKSFGMQQRINVFWSPSLCLQWESSLPLAV